MPSVSSAYTFIPYATDPLDSPTDEYDSFPSGYALTISTLQNDRDRTLEAIAAHESDQQTIADLSYTLTALHDLKLRIATIRPI